MQPQSDDERNSEAAAIESSEPVGSASDELPDLADALRAAQQDKQPVSQDASNDDDGDDDDADESDAPEQSPDEGSKPDAAPPAEPSRLSRSERRRQELEQARTEAKQAREDAERTKAEVSRAQTEVLQLLNAVPEWQALVQKKLDPNQVLGYDEEERYQALHTEMVRGGYMMLHAEQKVRVANESGLLEAAKEFDLPKSEILQHAANPYALAKSIVSATEARVRKETQDEILKLTADRDSLLLKRGARSPDPGTGGRYVAGRPDELDWDSAEPGDFFTQAMREKAGARS
jgi:hypothetical protein